MLCPFCGSEDTQVKDSRPAEDGSAIRRRRLCGACGARFTTFERVQLREITIVKRSGRRSVFDRDKLERSFQIALRKRDVNADDIARSINEIVRQMESHPDGDVPSAHVGELVMAALSELDQVAYVRYASVYRNFREAKDFEAFVEKELGD
ncbi:MAG TPA: transcriptional regulator NrdR [Alphaproteobacteria bacterium]|jgi:transcriptional repressor NrdR|nr:transcriptional regulator NrdR [Rhodospirillaceae bacterium]PDH63974.1 MAG: transcriptional regulator NrdR [SAR116 cluster bacterium MED-G05]HAO56712.1 transcriptional regulator NrdR [Alphaproteobacteria bacterium]MBM60472.1 transcriptional regulator NrdR [Rhodospirillaceae bacterium]HBD52360.1 transcriptional regulator NrdR [Alphaproteobacteria bacterium]|tara:strand:- start:9354 stop:9806 length:453 start_codon:yes stop_codon:yes gene_type:complete